MKKVIITIMLAFLVLGVNNVQASSPPWWGDGHYTFGDEDPYFVESAIFDFATVDIVGGSFGSLHCWDYSTVNMTGGDGAWLYANDSSELNLSGGTLGSLMAEDFSEVTFYVETYDFTPGGPIGTEGVLTGIWADDGGAFEIQLVRDGTLSHINFVPEPATLAIFGLGSLFLRR